MMRINGVSSGTPMASNPSSDAVSRNLQNQIASARKQLQELAKNQEMAPEEKMKKRQELNQQIMDLSNQLSQHEAELRKERRAEALNEKKSADTKTVQSEGAASVDITQAGMQALLTADTALKQAKVQDGVKAEMKGRAGVLKQEIKLDAGRGGAAEGKQQALSELEQKISDVSGLQMKSLSDANQTLQDSYAADVRNDKETADEEETKAAKKLDSQEENIVPEVEEQEKEEYTPIDIRL